MVYHVNIMIIIITVVCHYSKILNDRQRLSSNLMPIEMKIIAHPRQL